MSNLFQKFMAWLKGQVFLSEPALQVAPVAPTSPVATSNIDTLIVDWSIPKNAYHNTRVLCDQAGLTLPEKNLICACIYQESRFFTTAINRNRDAAGRVLSTDYSLCQVNDYYHIGAGKDFPSVQYVLDNPGAVVLWMIHMYQHGLLKQWVSYSSKAYMKWLTPGSPMWALGQ